MVFVSTWKNQPVEGWGLLLNAFEQRSKTRVPALRCSSPLVQTTKVTVSSERSRLLKAIPISVTPDNLTEPMRGQQQAEAHHQLRLLCLWKRVSANAPTIYLSIGLKFTSARGCNLAPE
jgi:hypothetical protein